MMRFCFCHYYGFILVTKYCTQQFKNNSVHFNHQLYCNTTSHFARARPTLPCHVRRRLRTSTSCLRLADSTVIYKTACLSISRLLHIRSGYCSSDLPSFGEMCEAADQQPFEKVLSNPNHKLHNLLPPPTVASQNYHLRPRSHGRQLPPHTGRLTDSNLLTRSLYHEIYWHHNSNWK